jgi:hypothetical protein
MNQDDWVIPSSDYLKHKNMETLEVSLLLMRSLKGTGWGDWLVLYKRNK